MKRLSLLLDDLAIIRAILSDTKIDPVRFAILAEHAGANSISCTYISKSKTIMERDLRLLKEINTSFFNLRIPIENEAMRLALSIIPDMVTFVDANPNSPRKINAVEPSLHQADIEEMLPNLQANNISVAILVKPEIEYLKLVSKLPFDYIELDALEYTEASDINDEILALDKLKSAALALGKWGMGVNCSGNIGYDDIDGLAQTPNLEDITMGDSLIRRALLVGIEQAIREALELMRYREID
jgi:pyridoxine 5-phosphate synthase